MERLMLDRGSGSEIMFPNLYKLLGLKPKDLSKYDFSLIEFDGRTMTPNGIIKFPMQTSSKVVEVDFIMVDAYSPYTAILARL